jgi:hypothetical protein
VASAPRTVQPLGARDEARVALSRRDTPRFQALPQPQGRVILALDGRPPDVGHAGLWVLRACLSGAVRLAQR